MSLHLRGGRRRHARAVRAFARLLSAGALGVLLVACGGSTGSDEAVPPTGTNSPPETPPPVPEPPEPPDTPEPPADTLDAQLHQLASASGVMPLGDAPAVPDALFNLGRALFDGSTGTLLSGTRTVSCSSCHQTNNAGVETAIPLHASLGSRVTVHRNAPDLVNKVLGGRRSMFWDGRVSVDDQGHYHTPAGEALPAGLQSLLAAQALFPLLSRDEMLGYPDDGSDANELADLSASAALESDPWPIWNGIVARVRADATLAALLHAAYPDVADVDLGIQHIANALAAFQARRWNPTLVPANFHAWLAGTGDLSSQAKRGGVLFFGKAGCAACHNGPLLSDGQFHNLAVPQIGPGFASGANDSPPRDKGRYDVTGDETDLYAFVTPSLWEVKVTPPYMHNGVYRTLEQAVRHHLDAASSANLFRCEDASAGVACRDSQTAPDLYADMIFRLAPAMRVPVVLTPEEISDLLAFLNQLTNGAN